MAATLIKKRRKKTRNSISSETSRAASPVGEPQHLVVTIKNEPDTAPFSPKGRTTPYTSQTGKNGAIKSPLHSKQMKTELDDAVLEDDPLTPAMTKADEDPIQMQILCKKVRQAQQTKGMWAQRALNLDINPIGDETLMKPPNNNPQSRLSNYGGADGLLKRSMPNAPMQVGGEKDDVSTDIIIPRERVISICNLDKDALDDYLNGGDNSQDQEAELLKYFQSDENPQNMSVDSKPATLIENNHQSNEMSAAKRMGYEKNISELRYYLQQNLQQQSDAAVARTIPQPLRGLPVVDSKGEIMHGLASTALFKLSANNRQLVQPKRNNNASSASSYYSAGSPLAQNITESVESPKQMTNVNSNIPQSPNSRRKNFSFVPISPGPESPSGQLSVIGPPNTKSTIFVSPRSASHRKSVKQSPSTTSISLNSNQTTPLNNHPYANSANAVYSRNHVALSAPPSPAPMQQIRNEHQMVQMHVQQSFANDGHSKRTSFEGATAEIFGNRSQSAPLHCQMPNTKTHMYSNNSSMSCTQSPILNDYSEMMDIVGSSADQHTIKMEQCATDLTVSNSLMRTQMPANQNLSLLNLSERDSSSFISNNMSRSVPSTPQPSQFFGNSGATSMTMYDISKSVPTTPLANAFCGTNTPFRYSPSEMNRDFLINGNTVEPVCGNSMSSAFFGSSSQHSQDHSDHQNSNLSDRDLRIVTEDIDELSSFGDAADPIIGSDLLNHL